MVIAGDTVITVITILCCQSWQCPGVGSVAALASVATLCQLLQCDGGSPLPPSSSLFLVSHTIGITEAGLYLERSITRPSPDEQTKQTAGLDKCYPLWFDLQYIANNVVWCIGIHIYWDET